jgi:hypothetical protein
MAFSTIQPAFSAGELSPALAARVDLAKYASGVRKLKNFFVHPHGGISNRPGFRYITAAKNPEGIGRLIPFIYSKKEAYVLEFSDRAVRFYFEGKPLCSEDGTIYEIESPYQENDLAELRYSQSADVLFICHPKYPPKRLERLGQLAWQFVDFGFKEGPFLPMNSSDVKMRVTGVGTVQPERDGVRFTTPGMFEFTVPEGVKNIRVRMIGGGAGVYYMPKWYDSEDGYVQLGEVCYPVSGGESKFANLKSAGGASLSDSCWGGSGLFPENGLRAGSLVNGYGGIGYGSGAGGRDGKKRPSGMISIGGKYMIRGATRGAIVDGNMSVTPGEVIQGFVGSGGSGANVHHGVSGCVDLTWQAHTEGRIGILEADEDVFRQDQVGALWKIRHSIPSESRSTRDPNNWQNGVFNLEVTAHSKWFVDTSGYWVGSVFVEKYDELNDKWTLIRTLNSQKDRNYSESGSVEENTRIRVRGNPFTRSVPAGGDGAMYGEVTLETLPTVYDGFVKIMEYMDAKTVKVKVEKRIGSNEWTGEWAEGAWSNLRGYPGCCTFYQDRLCFGGTDYEPGGVWMSRIGDYNHFGTSLPLKDDDAISIRLVSRRIGRIRSLIGISELIALTESGEWKIGNSKGALTPTSIEARPQGYRGSANLEPVLIGDRVIFLREMGSTVQDLGYSFESDTYTGSDLSILSKHMLEYHTIVDWEYRQEPDSVIWAVRSDGVLLGITYLREQEIWAWHRHETQGFFESIAVIPGEDQEELWGLIRREDKLLVEKLEIRETELEKCFYVDSGVTRHFEPWYLGEPAGQIGKAMIQGHVKGLRWVGGLGHLAGKEVSILADGAVWPRQRVRKKMIGKVENWGIELERPAQIVHIGLPYEAEVETLNIEIQADGGTLQGKKKKFPQVLFRFLKSCGGKVGATDREMDPIQWQSSKHYGKPMALYTGDKAIRPPGGYNEDGRLVLKQDDPLPITLLAIIPEVVIGG